MLSTKFSQEKMENETELRVVQQEEQQHEQGEEQPQNPPPLRRRFVIYLYVGYFLARWSARYVYIYFHLQQIYSLLFCFWITCFRTEEGKRMD